MFVCPAVGLVVFVSASWSSCFAFVARKPYIDALKKSRSWNWPPGQLFILQTASLSLPLEEPL